MNSIRTLLFLTLIVSIDLKAQIRPPIQQDFERFIKDLKGEFKSCTVIVYDAKEYFGELKKSSDIHKQKNLQFDSLQRITQIEEYRDGSQINIMKMNYSSDNLKITYYVNEKKDNFYGEYVLNKKNQGISLSFWRNDTLTHKETAKYNDKDSLVEYVKFNQEGKISEMKSWEFNNMNNLDAYTYLTENGYWREKYKYESTKKKTSTQTFNVNGNLESTTTYKYDDKNRLIQKLTINSHASNQQKTLYVYNPLGLLINETSYTSTDGIQFYLSQVNETKYDDNKRTVKKSSFHYYSDTADKSDWNYQYTKSFFYNGNGDLVESITSYEYKNPARSGYKNKANYIYDTYGNWIKVIESSSDNLNQPFELMDKHIVERIITYNN